jgi:hypothetical protein
MATFKQPTPIRRQHHAVADRWNRYGAGSVLNELVEALS